MERVCLVHLTPKGSYLILSEKFAVCPGRTWTRFFFHLCSQSWPDYKLIIFKAFTSKLKLELDTRGKKAGRGWRGWMGKSTYDVIEVAAVPQETTGNLSYKSLQN